MIYSKYMLVSSIVSLMGLGMTRAQAAEKVKVKVQPSVMKCERLGEALNCNPVQMQDPKVVEIELIASRPDMAPNGSWTYQISANSITFTFGIELEKQNGYYFSIGASDSRSNEAHFTSVFADSPEHLNVILVQGKLIAEGNSFYYPTLSLSSPSS
jgi:hypothetical protein